MLLTEHRDQIIQKARQSVDRFEKREHRRRGCHRGLDISSTLLSHGEFVAEIARRHEMERELAVAYGEGTVTAQEYWEFRAATAQLEFVHRRMQPLYRAEAGLATIDQGWTGY